MKRFALTSLFALVFLLGSHSLAQATAAPEVKLGLPNSSQLRNLEPELSVELTEWLDARNEELNTVLNNLVIESEYENHLAWEDSLVEDAENKTEELFKRIQLKTYVLLALLES